MERLEVILTAWFLDTARNLGSGLSLQKTLFAHAIGSLSICEYFIN